jgi:hypothetical protein
MIYSQCLIFTPREKKALFISDQKISALKKALTQENPKCSECSKVLGAEHRFWAFLADFEHFLVQFYWLIPQYWNMWQHGARALARRTMCQSCKENCKIKIFKTFTWQKKIFFPAIFSSFSVIFSPPTWTHIDDSWSSFCCHFGGKLQFAWWARIREPILPHSETSWVLIVAQKCSTLHYKVLRNNWLLQFKIAALFCTIFTMLHGVGHAVWLLCACYLCMLGLHHFFPTFPPICLVIRDKRTKNMSTL